MQAFCMKCRAKKEKRNPNMKDHLPDRMMHGVKSQWIAREHFNQLAGKYDHLRTLDQAPINYLVEAIPRSDQIICDLGCGTGRYLVSLIKTFQTAGVIVSGAYGVDISPGMLETARLESDGLNVPISWILGSSDKSRVPTRSVSLVTAFNSIHHLPIPETLAEVERILVPDGFFAIYTRLREQESEHIWGRWFPGYLDYTQVPTREFMSDLLCHDRGLRLSVIKDFTFKRKTSLSWVYRQTENRYYSTLARFPQAKFENAYSTFVENLKTNHRDQDEITFTSSYSLFLYQLGS